MPPKDRVGLLLVNLGTPDSTSVPDVRRYLDEFLSDPRVIEAPRWIWWLALHGVILRIRPRRDPAETPGSLIEDPWRILPCPPGDVCSVEFDDPEFPAAGRSALYYVRAVQEPTPALNGAGLRCQKRDESGVCLEVDPCYGDFRTPASDDCLAPVQERAWSSPIFVDPA